MSQPLWELMATLLSHDHFGNAMRHVASGRDVTFPLLIPNSAPHPFAHKQPDLTPNFQVLDHSNLGPWSAPHVSGSTMAEPLVNPVHVNRESESPVRAGDEPTLTKNQRRRLCRQHALCASHAQVASNLVT